MLSPIENKMIEVPDRSGAFYFGQKVSSRTEQVKITILADSLEELAHRKRMISGWLSTSEPKPFRYSYEDKEYQAILDGSTDLEKTVADGEVTLSFLIPDPYACGIEVKSQIIVGAPRVTEDTHTQRSWSEGNLDGVEASPNGLQLQKIGIDQEKSISQFDTGNHHQTQGTSKLTLDGTSLPTSQSYQDDFADGENINVRVVDGTLRIAQLPVWEERDNMESWSQSGWEAKITENAVSQTSDGARIHCSGVSAALVKDHPTLKFPQAFEFVYRLKPPTSPTNGYENKASFQIIEARDGKNYRFSISLDETSTLKWIRVVLTSPTTGDVYINGMHDRSIASPSVTSLTPRIQFIIDHSLRNQGDMDIIQFYRKSGVMHEKIGSIGFPYRGERVTPPIDLSSLGIYQSSEIRFETLTPTGFNGFDSTSHLKISILRNGKWSDYQTLVVGEGIPGLSSGDSLTGVQVKLKETLEVYDIEHPPQIISVGIVVNGKRFVYYTDGRYETLAEGLQSVTKARKATFSWRETKPHGTEIKCYLALEINGILGEFKEVANGADIPQVNPTMDLTKAKLFVRFDLQTTDPKITPEVNSYSYHFVTAYKPKGERISKGVALSSLKSIEESSITWDTTPDSSPDVELYVQFVEPSQTPTSNGWYLVKDNPSTIPNVDLTKRLYTKQVITSDGMTTPTLQRLLWEIEEKAGNIVLYDGTIKAYPKIRITFNQVVPDQFKIHHQETGKQLILNRSFQIGDEVEIQNQTGKVTTNGALDMVSLSIQSAFFFLQPGSNTFIVSPENVCTVYLEWKERFL
ncbi:putative phage tail component-like protein [Croceifilum oryzae]|uniref:Phage tail component-like protein n=2 Tax=Croceifilum oryzae TaxID=1553429 RepID=A0AAJ1WQV4_9BACL|nr:putative phage tail component-like protein [Croceifilum oryzae]